MMNENLLNAIRSIKGKVVKFPPPEILQTISELSNKIGKEKINDFIYCEHGIYLSPSIAIGQFEQGKIAEYAVWELLSQYKCSDFCLIDNPNWVDLMLKQYTLHVKSVNFETTLKYGDSYVFQYDLRGRIDPLFFRLNSTSDIIFCCYVDYVNWVVEIKYVLVWADISSLPDNDYERDLPSTWYTKKILHVDKLIENPMYAHLFI